MAGRLTEKEACLRRRKMHLLQKNGHSYGEIAKILGLSKSTVFEGIKVYRTKKEYKWKKRAKNKSGESITKNTQSNPLSSV